MAVNKSLPLKPGKPADDRLFLREEELTHGVELVLAASRALHAAMRDASRETGVNDTQLETLLAISAEPGLDVATLRARLGLPLPTLARILSQLDQAGLVDRSARPAGDARRRAIRLTVEGARQVGALIEPLQALLKNAYRDTGPMDVAGTRRVLASLLTHAGRPPAPGQSH